MSEFKVVFPLYPGVTQLDFTGPHEVFARVPGASCILASLEGGTLTTDTGMTFGKLQRLSDVADCSLLCVPGGYGTLGMLNSRAYLDELRRLAASARYVTSVCTGSMLLAAAGLLDGKRAACHWAWAERLARLGVSPDPRRVVRDDNTFTGGGVTAGIDMALTVVAELAGDEFAKGLELTLEYAPQPPFNTGRPELAPAEVVEAVKTRVAATWQKLESADAPR